MKWLYKVISHYLIGYNKTLSKFSPGMIFLKYKWVKTEISN